MWSAGLFIPKSEGRGVDGKNYVYLDIRPETVNRYATEDGRTNPDGSPYTITGDTVLKKIPDIVDFCRVYLGVDPVTQMMPTQPTAHYTMGGIPTNNYGEVVVDGNGGTFPGYSRRRMCVRIRP